MQQLFLEVHRQVDGQDLGWTWTSRAGVFMPGCDPVQPDVVMVLREQRDIMHDGRIYGVPALIAQVLSPSHPDLDNAHKAGCVCARWASRVLARSA
ncbi:MAG: Uma2 family endonuclease, partial [Chloroflexi bacterium]|nr:Uma2 family endonuclease [Chloroflexota bacterium]